MKENSWNDSDVDRLFGWREKDGWIMWEVESCGRVMWKGRDVERDKEGRERVQIIPTVNRP